MTVKFGVQTVDIEVARTWVEKATALNSEARESSDLGGNYYLFTSVAGERLKVISNRDVYDNEPIVSGCDSWKVVVVAEDVTSGCAIVRDLERDVEHFIRVE